MNVQTDDLDFSLAINAWKTLWLEAHNNQSRAERVWQPTQHLLDKLVSNAASSLTCFAGKYYMFPADSDGVAVNLFFLGANNEVAYFGTMFDNTAYHLDKTSEANRLLLINPNFAQKLTGITLGTIVRDAHFCKIPVDSDLQDVATATSAVRRYLAVRAPIIAGCAIHWLAHEQGIRFENHIRKEAERTAQKPTYQDRLLATAEDELELLV